MTELHQHCEIVDDPEAVVARWYVAEDVGGIAFESVPPDPNTRWTNDDLATAGQMYGQEANRRRRSFKGREGVAEPSVGGYAETARQAVKNGGFVVRVTADDESTILNYLSMRMGPW